MNDRKRVYVLGAGFSMAAGGPSQDQLLGQIVENSNNGDLKSLNKFIRDCLNIKEDQLPRMRLEDIYTPIDRCLADQVSLRGMNPIELLKVRENLDQLVAKAIKSKFDRSDSNPKFNKARESVKNFADALVKIAAKRSELAHQNDGSKAKNYDPFSIISLNWDILLDNEINKAIGSRDQKNSVKSGLYDPFGVVDYCCYVSSLRQHDNRIRTGLWSLGCKGYNVKLLKLHGSLNWLQCMNCQRLFTAFNEKVAVSEKVGKPCRHCEKLRQNRLSIVNRQAS